MVRLNQAALDLLQVELRSRSRSSYAQVNLTDALKSLDTVQAPVASAETADIVNQLVAHRLQRLHDSKGNSATYRELRKLVIDLIPNFPDAVLQKAAKLNRPALADVPMVWPALPLLQWSNLMLAAMVGGIGVLVLPLLQTIGAPNLAAVGQQLHLPLGGTRAIAEVQLPSNELIPTAKTFAAIVQQSMKGPALPVSEWQRVVNQWQEAIDLLAQVPSADAQYAKAQILIQSYQQQQAEAKTRLQQEYQSSQALKSATGRVSWLVKRRKSLNPHQRAEALQAVEVQLKPVVEGTTGHAAGQALRDRLKQQMK
jgi:hypothetical protein